MNGFTVSTTSQDELFCDVDGNSYITAMIEEAGSLGDIYRNWCKSVGTRFDRRLGLMLSSLSSSLASLDVISFDSKSLTCPIWHILQMLGQASNRHSHPSPRVLCLSHNRICDNWEEEGMTSFPGGIMTEILQGCYPTRASNSFCFDKLKVLNLAGNRLSALSLVPLLSSNVSASVLEVLDLSDNNLDDTIFTVLEPFLRGNLKELSLSGNSRIKLCSSSGIIIESFRKQTPLF